MWTLLTDCGKQIIPHCKMREKNSDVFNIYEVTMIEFDQYHLKLLSRNGVAVEEEGLVLKCDHLLAYGFEIEVNEE